MGSVKLTAVKARGGQCLRRAPLCSGPLFLRFPVAPVHHGSLGGGTGYGHALGQALDWRVERKRLTKDRT